MTRNVFCTVPPVWFTVPLAVEPLALAEATYNEPTVNVALSEIFTVPEALPTSPTLKSPLFVKEPVPIRVNVALSVPSWPMELQVVELLFIAPPSMTISPLLPYKCPENKLGPVNVSVPGPVLVNPNPPWMLPEKVVLALLLAVSVGAPDAVATVPLPARLAKV